MKNYHDDENLYARHDKLESMIKSVAADLKLDEKRLDQLREKLARMTSSIERELAREFGAAALRNADLDIDFLLVDFLSEVGHVVDGARSIEAFDASMQSTGTMLRALAAGGLVGSRDPAEGRALFDAFGGDLKAETEG